MSERKLVRDDKDGVFEFLGLDIDISKIVNPHLLKILNGSFIGGFKFRGLFYSDHEREYGDHNNNYNDDYGNYCDYRAKYYEHVDRAPKKWDHNYSD